ncbi:type II secretion system minor pseudopilin GspJ [Novilysobacter erysipheiresistens]|uniref:Type II secretion system protein J n=1 Tax=Novilysobacter erysipheiresistens TaxID=1749332 RepID=A0ABU7YUX1_9GAMM
MSARGFTLVEMLVALLVFALLSAVGVTVMAYAADNQGVVQARMDRLGEFQRARALLKADLAQAAPRRVRERDGMPARNAFVGSTAGEGRAMSGAAPLLALVRRGWTNPDAEPRASMQYVEYRLVDGQLERSVRTALDGAAPGVPQVMLAGIESATIGYHYRGQWIDGWPGGATSMPDAVRLELQLEGLGRIEQLFLLPGADA